MDNTDWEELVGTRCLVKLGHWELCREECIVIEVSPSGANVRLKSEDKRVAWYSKWKIELLEVLDAPPNE